MAEQGPTGNVVANGVVRQSSFSSLLSGKPLAAKPSLKKSGSASSIVTMRAAGDGWETASTASTASKGSAASLKAAMCRQGLGAGLSLGTAPRSGLANGLGGTSGFGFGTAGRAGPLSIGLLSKPPAKGVMDAAGAGDLVLLRSLVESVGLIASAGVDLNARDLQGKTALMYAVTSGSKAVVEYILKRRTDVNAVDTSTKSALHHVSKRARARRAAEFDAEQQEIVRLLLAYRAILESRDGNGCTPLMLAVANGDEAVARCLLECRADVRVRDTEGQTCVDFAVDFEHKGLADILREEQARQERDGVGPPAFPRPGSSGLGSSVITRESGTLGAASRPAPRALDHSESSEDEVEVEVFGGIRGCVEVGPPERREGERKERKERKEKKEKKEKEHRGQEVDEAAPDGDAAEKREKAKDKKEKRAKTEADSSSEERRAEEKDRGEADQQVEEERQKQAEAAALAVAREQTLTNLRQRLAASVDLALAVADVDAVSAALKAAIREAQDAGIEDKDIENAEVRVKELKKVSKAMEKIREAIAEKDVRGLQKALGKAEEAGVPTAALEDAKICLAEEERKQEARDNLRALKEGGVATIEQVKEAIAKASAAGVKNKEVSEYNAWLIQLETRDQAESQLKDAIESRDVEGLRKAIDFAAAVALESKLVKKASKVLKEEEPKRRARESLAALREGEAATEDLRAAIALAKEVGLDVAEYARVEELLRCQEHRERCMAAIGLALQECQVVDMSSIDALREAKEKLGSAIKEANEAGVPESCLLEADTRRKKLHNAIEDLKGSIRVFCRIRPLSSKEKDQGDTQVTNATGSMTLDIDNKDDGKSTFSFDAVFTPGTQEEVFEDCRDLVQSAVDGYNVTIFAYGQTGAGKTFTMYGAPGNEGTTPRTIQELYRVTASQSARFDYTINASMLELYRNDLVDLLSKGSGVSAGSKKPLNIKMDKQGRINIENIVEEKCEGVQELSELLERGMKQRTVAATQMNSESSRSHLVVIIKIDGVNRETGETQKGKILMCDLAGSERLKKSQVTEDMQKEAIEINKSLTALGDVIEALTKAQKSVPYRNHKLTQLMQDSLGGTSKTLMFVNCSPANSNLDETLMSLKYATRAKKITNTAQKGT